MRLMRVRLILLAVLTLTAAMTLSKPVAAQSANGIQSPSAGRSVSGLMEISGTAAHASFRKWQLDLLLNGDEQQAIFLAVGEEPVPARRTLATVDTSLYPPGEHALRLRVVHSNLNYDEYLSRIVFGVSQTTGVKQQPKQQALTNVIVDIKNRMPTGTPPLLPSPKANNIKFTPPADGSRWIEVDISDQTLRAWEGDKLFLETLISSGRPETPTVAGTFAIQSKLESQRMRGPDYDLPDVPSVMYFFLNYAIHAAYWHDNFGEVMSHGCVNMNVDQAAALFDWAAIGTPVYVHD